MGAVGATLRSPRAPDRPQISKGVNAERAPPCRGCRRQLKRACGHQITSLQALWPRSEQRGVRSEARCRLPSLNGRSGRCETCRPVQQRSGRMGQGQSGLGGGPPGEQGKDKQVCASCGLAGHRHVQGMICGSRDRARTAVKPLSKRPRPSPSHPPPLLPHVLFSACLWARCSTRTNTAFPNNRRVRRRRSMSRPRRPRAWARRRGGATGRAGEGAAQPAWRAACHGHALCPQLACLLHS